MIAVLRYRYFVRLLRSMFCAALVCVALSAATGHAQLIESFTEPYDILDLASPESGIVSVIHAKEGAHIEGGQVLAELDNEVLRRTLELARVKAMATSTRDAAQAEYKMHSRRLEKLKSLRSNGHASEEEVLRTQTDAEIARAKLRGAEEQMEQANIEVKRIEAQLRRRMVISPIRGQIERIHKDVGEYVAATEPLLVTIVRLDLLKVKLYLTTEHAQHLKHGDKLSMILPATEQRTVGTIEFVSPTTDADSGTVRVEAVVDNRDGKIRSGVRVTLADLQ